MSELQDWKRDGFRGEKMIVLPTESFQDYVEHPLVRRLYLTDVGVFPHAQHHFRERKDGIEEYIYMYCIEGSGTIEVEGTSYTLHANQAFCIPKMTHRKHWKSWKEHAPWIRNIRGSGWNTTSCPISSTTRDLQTWNWDSVRMRRQEN